MEAAHESGIGYSICMKSKPRQKKCDGERIRSSAGTPMLLYAQRVNDSGLQRKTASWDDIKIRSHSRTNAIECRQANPDLELHPQPSRCFSAEEAEGVIKRVLDKELKDSSYDATRSQQRAMDLAELVKGAVKELRYERYKLVCFVVLGPVSQGAICCCSKSVWSPNSDTYAEYLFQNQSLFALCVVFAGYCE
ncbi:dynein light chain Tctex-type 5-A-like [Gastrophryne carolinensis]